MTMSELRAKVKKIAQNGSVETCEKKVQDFLKDNKKINIVKTVRDEKRKNSFTMIYFTVDDKPCFLYNYRHPSEKSNYLDLFIDSHENVSNYANITSDYHNWSSYVGCANLKD